MATSFCRGWEITDSLKKGRWIYVDTGEPMDMRRPCRYCGRPPTPEGHDACLGTIKGAISACCGHGATKPFIMKGEGTDG